MEKLKPEQKTIEKPDVSKENYKLKQYILQHQRLIKKLEFRLREQQRKLIQTEKMLLQEKKQHQETTKKYERLQEQWELQQY